MKKPKLKLFHCALFINDEKEDGPTIIEDIIEAKDEEWAVSELLSREAIKRKMAYYWLKEKVIDSLVKPV